MKIVIPGGAGLLGRLIARNRAARGDEVVVLSRGDASAPDPSPARRVHWDGRTQGPWCAEIDGADVVVNLAGRSVNCRYHARNRREIMDSRIESTRAIGAAIAAASRPPRVWLQASTATIYEHRFDAANDEATGILGGSEPNAPSSWRFSIEVATEWERAAREGVSSSTRLALLRTSIVMSPDRGSAFDVLLGLVRHGLGGAQGDGKQWVSWIHEDDFVAAVDWLIDHEVDGAVNLAAPNPLPNREFMRELRRAWGASIGLPATEWMLEIGAIFLRTETELILKSRRVVPRRLVEDGFRFRFPRWGEAANDLIARWKATDANRAPRAGS